MDSSFFGTTTAVNIVDDVIDFFDDKNNMAAFVEANKIGSLDVGVGFNRDGINRIG